jgi:acetate kinase
MQILVLNCGSSSLKFALYGSHGSQSNACALPPAELTKLASGIVEGIGTPKGRLKGKLFGSHTNDDAALTEIPLPQPDHLKGFLALQSWLEQSAGMSTATLQAIGHRVVHGGEKFSASVRIDDEVMAAIEACNPLAPLHNPANLLGIRESMKAWPGVAQVAVFDTAFHASMPRRAYTYAVPRALYEQHGVRRYGFHGTSHRFMVQGAAELLGRPVSELALVTAHLGNGCSAAAVLGGRSMDTTLGLTPLEGLVMGTRSGDVDPGLFDFLERTLGWSAAKTTSVLNKESGLLGLSGLSQDMRELKAARAQGHEGAALALEVFSYRLAKSIASLVVPLGRLDALVFTGGIGENNADTRAEVVGMLGFLGLEIDPVRNEACRGGVGGVITRAPTDADGLRSSSCALVVPTDEELLIAQDSRECVCR